MNISFLFPMLVYGIFLVAGLIMKFYPPKAINSLYGYRTTASMKSQAHWDFSQKYSANLMIKLAIVFLYTSPIGLFIKEEEMVVLLHLGLMLIIVFLLLFKTEKAIKHEFQSKKS
jgi:uncharacterized membrane protein